jgi:iron(III) transport system substrate-binding protein
MQRKLIIGVALLSVLLFFGGGCSRSPGREVVVYAAQDQVYAEPIFREFTRLTGIAVKPVFDSEAVKTVGLANRLLAEKNHPQGDLFWGNEELRARQLRARGVFPATNGLFTFGVRTRRLVYNTNLLTQAAAPHSFSELTNAQWRGRVALAYPLFGTTATHFQALRQRWGEAGWLAWCRALTANQPLQVEGNSSVVRMVARGQAAVGMTDSDDILAAQAEGQPVATVPPHPETLIIPNAVGLVQGAPHPEAARQLLAYLQGEAVLQQLVKAGALEGAAPGAERGLSVDWDRLLTDLEPATEQLRSLFLRNTR